MEISDKTFECLFITKTKKIDYLINTEDGSNYEFKKSDLILDVINDKKHQMMVDIIEKFCFKKNWPHIDIIHNKDHTKEMTIYSLGNSDLGLR